jgi:hypothetical protein
MNASPNKLPTATLTMTKMICFNRRSLVEINTIPTSDKRLTKTTLARA